MDTTNQNNENQPSNVVSENEIRNHRETAAHLETAARHHLSAAKYYEEGNTEKATECSNKAQEYTDKAINGTNESSEPQISL
jgi:hypothetical protein